MLPCVTWKVFFFFICLFFFFIFISCNVNDSTVQIQTWVSEGHLASFSLLAVLHITLFHSVHFQQSCAEEYFKYIQGIVVFSYMEIFIYPCYSRKCRFLNLLNMFFPSYLETCICTFRNDPTRSLPVSTRTTSLSSSFSLLLLLLLLEGWIYFAHVTVRKFTKTIAICVRILHIFTYFISSDKVFSEVQLHLEFSILLGVHIILANYNQSSMIPEPHAGRGVSWFIVGDLRHQLR